MSAEEVTSAYRLMQDLRQTVVERFKSSLYEDSLAGWCGDARIQLLHAALLLSGKTSSASAGEILTADEKNRFGKALMGVADSITRFYEQDVILKVHSVDYGYTLHCSAWDGAISSSVGGPLMHYLGVIVTWSWQLGRGGDDWITERIISPWEIGIQFPSSALPIVSATLATQPEGEPDLSDWTFGMSSRRPATAYTDVSTHAERRRLYRRKIAEARDSAETPIRVSCLYAHGARLSRPSFVEFETELEKVLTSTESTSELLTCRVPWTEGVDLTDELVQTINAAADKVASDFSVGR